MISVKKPHFLGKVNVFQESYLPEKATPVGYAALIEAYNLSVPLPIKLSAVGERHQIYESADWKIYTPRHMPNTSFEGHLTFSLKYEGLDLAVLKKLFRAISPEAIATMVKQHPTSSYSRRVWFLYEWLLEKRLDLPDAKAAPYVDVVDSKKQFAIKGKTSPRHRVRNNLPGTRNFCPMIFNSQKINNYINSDLASLAKETLGKVSKGVLARTASFLLLKDSKSSYAIEGEGAAHSRIQRWGKVIGEAGKRPLDLNELLRLQKIVIGDSRFIKLGFREEGGFVGEHERDTRFPLPEHISAKAEDLVELIEGILEFDRLTSNNLDPVIAAAIIAFAFVYIHPFEDGNGRLHRYLIHHVLSSHGFNPPGVTFPISAAMLDGIDEYRQVLESYSTRLLPVIDWEPTKNMNVNVLNDTSDFYRYFDATPHVEFLYACVEKTVTVDLPAEISFLQSYDLFKQRVEALVEMSAIKIDLLFNFLRQNDGCFSKRALGKEFSKLTPDEIKYIEATYTEVFDKN